MPLPPCTDDSSGQRKTMCDGSGCLNTITFHSCCRAMSVMAPTQLAPGPQLKGYQSGSDWARVQGALADGLPSCASTSLGIWTGCAVAAQQPQGPVPLRSCCWL